MKKCSKLKKTLINAVFDSTEKPEDKVDEKQREEEVFQITSDLYPLNSIDLTEIPLSEHMLRLKLKEVTEITMKQQRLTLDFERRNKISQG